MNNEYRKTSSCDETTPVLIVGGSLVGLSMSLILSWHGIHSILVERHASISPHPRASHFNVRTMEWLRTFGIENAIHLSEPPTYLNRGVLRAESLAGQEFAWITQDTTGSDLSPVQGSFIGQDALEPILRKRAEELGGDLRFHTELLSFQETSDGVSAVLLDRTTGTECSVRAHYLVAADGHHSRVRRQLGIGIQGPGILGHQISILFHADLQEALRGRRIALCFVNNPTVQGGTLVLVRGDGRGFALYAHYFPERGESAEDFQGERGIALVRAAIGIPDLPVQIINARPWEVAAWTAERLQQGNVFLVGDAGHVMPPTGAFGANTGIADAVNLAWKLALVLKQVASPALLTTYTTERQPVAQRTVEHAYSLFTQLASPTARKSPGPGVDYARIALGYRYQPALPFADMQEYQQDEDPHHPTGSSGTHAAHIYLARNGKRYSTLDLFGQHFVLLIGSDGQAWHEAAQHVSQRFKLDLDIYHIGPNGSFTDPDNRFLLTYRLTSTGAVLIRPDGFIIWKAEQAENEIEQKLEWVFAQILGLALTQPGEFSN